MRSATTLASVVALSLVAVAAFFAAPSHAQATTDLVWWWKHGCAHSIRLVVTLDGKPLADQMLPVCREPRSAQPHGREWSAIHVTFAPARSIRWLGYRDDDPVSEAGKPLSLDIWQAGGEPNALLLGVSVASSNAIYMNTIHIASPVKRQQSALAEGLLIVTQPAQ